MIFLWRLSAFLVCTGAYCILSLPFLLLSPLFPWWSRRHAPKAIAFVARILCYLLNVQVQIKGLEHFRKDKNYFFVCNHLSYIDIIIIAPFLGANFVTSVEMKQSFFLGQLSILGGCLFVERRDKRGLGREVAQITEAMVRGHHIFIFPEGTSTNGDEVLRFRRPLFRAAMDAQREVLPLTLNYVSVDGVPVTKKNRDLLFWYGDMSFAPHFLKYMQTHQLKVDLELHAPLNPKDFPDVIALSERAREIVAGPYRPIS